MQEKQDHRKRPSQVTAMLFVTPFMQGIPRLFVNEVHDHYPPPTQEAMRLILRSRPLLHQSRLLRPCRTGSDRPHHPHPSARRSKGEQRPREPASACR
jgi:hypothetical protein